MASNRRQILIVTIVVPIVVGFILVLIFVSIIVIRATDQPSTPRIPRQPLRVPASPYATAPDSYRREGLGDSPIPALQLRRSWTEIEADVIDALGTFESKLSAFDLTISDGDTLE